jgi:hypothetical protein
VLVSRVVSYSYVQANEKKNAVRVESTQYVTASAAASYVKEQQWFELKLRGINTSTKRPYM